MKTLIELYDERPIENVLATEMFRPERTVFLCPGEVARNGQIQKKLREYFAHRGVPTETVFLETELYRADKVTEQLELVNKTYPECALDITGGTDAALFAGGLFCGQNRIPVFTYSRRQNCFFNIDRAPFADRVSCTVQHRVEDCFLMAGGAMRTGRVENEILGDYAELFSPFFEFFLRHRWEWKGIVGYIQRVSQNRKGELPGLEVRGDYTVKNERGGRISAPERALRELEALGMICDLSVRPGEEVSFEFRDLQMRTWLRDIGSVLELYIYKLCRDTGVFHDVRTSVVVDWEGGFRQDDVTNEIDVMAVVGIRPVFISCKTGEVSTEALNELAILRDRFGGSIAEAAIVTAERCRAITRHRAEELDIHVIDLEDLRSGEAIWHLESLARSG